MANRASWPPKLADAPFNSRQVLTTADRARALSRDPVAIGILGALSLGFVAAALFAVVGLVVSAAVSARERRTEFAVLRALGLSGGQLSRWLWLENGSVVAVSVLAGTGLGLVLGWLVLPFVTVTQQGSAPVPAGAGRGAVEPDPAARRHRRGHAGRGRRCDRHAAAPHRGRQRAADGGRLSDGIAVGRRRPAAAFAPRPHHGRAAGRAGCRHELRVRGRPAPLQPRGR